MIVYPSRFLSRGEVWFDEEPDALCSVDWILYHHRTRPVPRATWRYFYNYVVDLTQSAEQLRARLNSDTAYKIRRARDRDQIGCERCDPGDAAELDRFERMYNSFAEMKGLLPLDRTRIERLAAAEALDLCAARDQQGNTLVYHANYRDRVRATQLYLPSLYRKLSASASRNLISRASRYLTWYNILRYKDQGLQWFDFGGWYPGTTDSARLKINEFKRGFGGRVVREYECSKIVTLKGWIVLHTARLLKGARLFPSGSRKGGENQSGPDASHLAAAPASARTDFTERTVDTEPNNNLPSEIRQ